MTEQEFDALLEEVAGMLPERRMNFAPGMEAPKPQWVPEQNFNGLDPMTPAQREASRRAVADATFHKQAPGAAGVAAELTGIPSVARGQYQAYAGVNEGNPARVVKGMGETALGVSPYIPGYNLTTAALGLLGMQADDTMPGAQAAGREMPPLPVRDPREVQPPAEVTTSVPPPQQPSTWQTAYDQVVNNASRAGEAISGLYTGLWDEIDKLSSGSTTAFTPPSYEEWAAKNAAGRLESIKRLEDEASSEAARGGFGPKARNLSERAAAMRKRVEADFKTEVERQRTEFERQKTLRFSERNPKLATVLTTAPAVGAALLYRRRLGKFVDDQKSLMAKARPTQADRDAMAGLVAGPKLGRYILGGVGGSNVAQGGMDVYDIRTMEPGSIARKRTRDAYTTWDGIAETAAGSAARTLMALGMLPVGAMTARKLSPIDEQRALAFGNIPNAAADKLRAAEARKIGTDTLYDRAATAIAGRRARAAVPPAGGQATPIPTSARQTGPSGPAATVPRNQSGRPNHNQGSGQGAANGPATGHRNQSQGSTSFTPRIKEAVRAKFAENGGRITKSDFDAIAPGLSEKSRQAYVNRLEKAWKALGPDGFKRAIPYMAGVGGLAILPKQSD